MTSAQLKKYLKTMDKDKLEEALMALYKASPKNKKEVFEITITNINEGKPAPAKNAEVPNLKQLQKNMDFMEETAFYSRQVFYGYLPLSKKRKVRTLAAETYQALLNCPKESAVYEEASLMLEVFYGLVSRIMAENDGYAYGLDLWVKLKQTRDSFFGLLITRRLEDGISREKLQEAMELAVNVFAPDNEELISLYETFLSRLKIGDARYELLEMMEDFARNPCSLHVLDETDRESQIFWARFLLLYLILAGQEIGPRAAMDFLNKEADPGLRMAMDYAVPLYEKWLKKTAEQEKAA